jgi:hypothetical protein
LNENLDKSDQELWDLVRNTMKRFAVFAIVGPPLAAATLFLVLLPVAGALEGVPVEISTPVASVYSYAVLAALVLALFD